MLALSDNARGALYMMVSMAAFVINDAFMKSLAGEVPLFQAIFLRGLAATVLTGALAAFRGELRHRVEPANRRLLALRLIGEIGGTTSFLYALFHMPIANATAILQVIPLAVTLAAALALGEPVGWRRYLAILIGFLGVLIIVRPGAEGFNAYSLSALAAVGFMVLRDLTTRRLSAAIPSTFVAFTTALAITFAGGLATAASGDWVPVRAGMMATLALAAVFLFTGYLFIVMAMRQGEIGVISPFRYTILIWAIVLGWVLFAERPDAMMLAGAGLIAATGIYALRRERLRLGAEALARREAGIAALSGARAGLQPPLGRRRR